MLAIASRAPGSVALVTTDSRTADRQIRYVIDQTPGSPMNQVCIVDDDEAVRDSLSVFLEACGYGVVAFASALAFLAALDTGPFLCLLLDMHMPGMSGLELAEVLRARGNETPIYIVTAAADTFLRAQGARVAKLEFLDKPVDGDSLLNALSAVSAGTTS